MDETPLLIIGSGGYAREVVTLIDQIGTAGMNWKVVGFVSPTPPESFLLRQLSIPWLGGDEALLNLSPATQFIVAIGNPHIRKRLAVAYQSSGLQAASLRHPMTSFGSSVSIGAGTIVSAFVSATTNIHIGEHVHVDRSVTIGHDSRIGDFATIHPGAVLSGSVIIGDCVEVGSNSCILQGVHVGTGAKIGAGAVVTKSVPAGSIVAGVPARELMISRTSQDIKDGD